MSFMAILFLGVITSLNLPVSLMPDIDIPEITVQVNYENTPAREMENTILKPIRQQLLQVGHLDKIESEARDGSGIIKMKFKFGTNINYAYIESNEKIDDAMGRLPKGMVRPRVIKASATDIPVFNLMVSRNADWENQLQALEMGEFVRSVILRRIEQLPEVAMVDVSGLSWPELAIFPDYDKLKALEITEQDLIGALEENNVTTVGNLMVREGHYQFNVNFRNYLRDLEDIENIYIKKENQLHQIKDLARLELRPKQRSGLFHNRDKEAIVMAIIKQSDARMEDLDREINTLLDEFRGKYKELSFEIEKDQSRILRFSMNNLKQSLLFGAFLAVIIMLLFLRDFRSPLLIALSIPVSLVICFLAFYLLGVSINIISLSGLVLAVGMMIDNSIIVIDNIDQYIRKGEPLGQACIKGTNEVIRPLISSALTTSAVFIPLIFLSGISGALFFDQAIAVTVGLFISFFVSITLLPMLYHLVNKGRVHAGDNKFLARINKINYDTAYEKGFDHVFKFKWLYFLLFFLILGSGYLLFKQLDVKRLPEIEQTELVAMIDWNEPIHVQENIRRVQEIMSELSDSVVQFSVMTGEQQFLLNRSADRTLTSSELYIHTLSTAHVGRIESKIRRAIKDQYAMAVVNFHPPDNIFEALFSDESPDLVARIRDVKTDQVPGVEEVQDFLHGFDFHDVQVDPIAISDQILIEIDPELLLLYDVSFSVLSSFLKTAFNQNEIGMLKTYQRFVPIILGDDPRTVLDIVDQALIRNSDGADIPLASLIKIKRAQTYKSIRAGRDGEYVPINIFGPDSRLAEVYAQMKEEINRDNRYDAMFAGKFFTDKEMINELLMVLLVSVLLLYFILAAQFESFIQPLIVLIEIPIDIAGAFFVLWLAGGSLNLMAAIGIIVMSGIIINDSILKIDTINRARWSGLDLMTSIKLGGQRRLKPIIMTSLTTILALVPFLFFRGLGAELQRPLALTVIGGMTLGTLVSLFFIPLAYWAVYRKKS